MGRPGGADVGADVPRLPPLLGPFHRKGPRRPGQSKTVVIGCADCWSGRVVRDRRRFYTAATILKAGNMCTGDRRRYEPTEESYTKVSKPAKLKTITSGEELEKLMHHVSLDLERSQMTFHHRKSRGSTWRCFLEHIGVVAHLCCVTAALKYWLNSSILN